MIAARPVAETDLRPRLQQNQLAPMLAYLQRIFAAVELGEERFHAIFLDLDRYYIDDCVLAHGNSAHMPVRLRELFARALALGAHSLIVAHNHPSGDCRPSKCDITSTRRLLEIGRALDIELLDHLIITCERIYSMRAGGKL
jgi:DNA repair protein RadC